MTEQSKFDAAENLNELDPELTERLARALDRFQMAQPYQQSRRSPEAEQEIGPLPELTPEQKAARELMLKQELSAFMTVAGQLYQQFNSARPAATPDLHYRDGLKEELRRAAQARKNLPENS